jgi:hypothetical protein
VTRAAKSFFIHVVHSPLETVGHVTAPELSPRESRARSYTTHESTETHLSREVRCGVEGHVVISEPSSVRR